MGFRRSGACGVKNLVDALRTFGGALVVAASVVAGFAALGVVLFAVGVWS